ncbi:hypothetical protein [Cohnella rhizosphaerae]|nr:hypothetical protein [Cohnella rhizosphaerae]
MMRVRQLYYAQLRQGAERAFRQQVGRESAALREGWESEGLREISVFACGPYVCMYAERLDAREGAVWDWPRSYETYLEKWPPAPSGTRTGGADEAPFRLAVPMIDIFHDGLPEELEASGVRFRPEERIGTLARLKPALASSYIYYHYQRQEETPGSFNASCVIGSAGALLFNYRELPAVAGAVNRQGLLTTRLSPADWHEVMAPHFDPWADAKAGEELWRRMVRIV